MSDFTYGADIWAALDDIAPVAEKHYLNVPFEEKDDAKALGAKFDWNIKKWYYDGDDLDKFSKWLPVQARPCLSDEQQAFIDLAASGRNILVDACIGSGKTMSIQALCDKLSNKKILYLTYNMLLKLDAQSKIINGNTFVTNYHGYAYSMLKEAGISCSQSELIQTFLENKDSLIIPYYDLLVIDEYQDIDREISEMLQCIKDANPSMQIVAVGDMEQKIYDKTDLNASSFIDGFLDDHDVLEFTKCFRISKDLAARLGSIWHKKIDGVNNNCNVEFMSADEAVNLLKKCEPSEILCLGARTGTMTKVLNKLETEYPKKFNKNTVYASIADEDRGSGRPDKDSAVFTTFDSSKGLERKVCVVFDFTEKYWDIRIRQPNTRYEILRNIFCVAMSRGKDRIVFVKSGVKGDDAISTKTLSTPVKDNVSYARPFNISDMFSFKFKEDVERCYNMLDIKPIDTADKSVIDVVNHDGHVDLSPCIGNLQEAAFFTNYDIDKAIEFACDNSESSFQLTPPDRGTPLEDKILYLTAIETDHLRYVKQVDTPFLDDITLRKICHRLTSVFDDDETVQVRSKIVFRHSRAGCIEMDGMCDVLRDNEVYELKFVTELSHEHCLQCAMYSIMFGLQRGILWNVRDNTMYEIRVPDEDEFLKAVVRTVTKGCVKSKNINFLRYPSATNGFMTFCDLT